MAALPRPAVARPAAAAPVIAAAPASSTTAQRVLPRSLASEYRADPSLRASPQDAEEQQQAVGEVFSGDLLFDEFSMPRAVEKKDHYRGKLFAAAGGPTAANLDGHAASYSEARRGAEGARDSQTAAMHGKARVAAVLAASDMAWRQRMGLDSAASPVVLVTEVSDPRDPDALGCPVLYHPDTLRQQLGMDSATEVSDLCDADALGCPVLYHPDTLRPFPPVRLLADTLLPARRVRAEPPASRSP